MPGASFPALTGRNATEWRATMEKGKFDLHEQITGRIVAALEAGAGEFQMPWHGSGRLPFNAVSKKNYRGVNILSLWLTAQMQGYGSPEWATFKQWQERGAGVRKGEKGSLIVFYKTFESEDAEADDEKRRSFVARPSWVFNAAQVDGYQPKAEPRPDTQFDRLENVEAVIAATGATISFGGSRAFYHRFYDRIQIPEARDFVGSKTSTPQEAFYSTLLHELAHWTGAESRLNREKGKRFADRLYAYEELIAELSAAFLCAELGVTNEPRADHAQYLDGFLKVLHGDKRAIFTAAAAASAAVDFIMGFSRREEAA
jgi:antirestriction protein ArdC